MKMNLKPLIKLFSWIWKNRDNIQKVIDTINTLKNAVKTGEAIGVTALPPVNGKSFTEALIASDLTGFRNDDSALFNAQQILFEMPSDKRKPYYYNLAGHYYAVLTGIDPEAAKVRMKEEYLKTKLKIV